jgi:hypothetical protein
MNNLSIAIGYIFDEDQLMELSFAYGMRAAIFDYCFAFLNPGWLPSFS